MWFDDKMKKKIKIIIETEEDNEKIQKCLKVYFLDALKKPEKQLIEIKVEDIENEKRTK